MPKRQRILKLEPSASELRKRTTHNQLLELFWNARQELFDKSPTHALHVHGKGDVDSPLSRVVYGHVSLCTSTAEILVSRRMAIFVEHIEREVWAGLRLRRRRFLCLEGTTREVHWVLARWREELPVLRGRLALLRGRLALLRGRSVRLGGRLAVLRWDLAMS